MNNQEPEVITGRNLDSLISEALDDPSIKALFKHFGLAPVKESIVDAQAAKYERNEIVSKVLALQLDKKDAVITFTKRGTEIKATATVQLNEESKGYQAVGNKVYKVVNTRISDSGNEYIHEWFENPLFEIDDLPKTTEAQSSQARTMSSCSVCTTICNAVTGTGCSLGGTAACIVVCVSFASIACPFICGALYGLKCLGDTTILCGPSCKQLGYC